MIRVRRIPKVRFISGLEEAYVRGNAEEEYYVDLSAYQGNGFCGCKDFEVNCMPDLEKGFRGVTQYRCKHIRQARLWREAIKLAKARIIREAAATGRIFPEQETVSLGAHTMQSLPHRASPPDA